MRTVLDGLAYALDVVFRNLEGRQPMTTAPPVPACICERPATQAFEEGDIIIRTCDDNDCIEYAEIRLAAIKRERGLRWRNE